MPRDDLIQLRRGTAAEWTAANPTLAAGETGVETDTGRVKAGDGSTAWTTRPYSDAGGAAPSLVRGVHIPGGSLDVWKAARDASATALCEVAIFGDSTTSGEGPLTGGWVPKLRALSVADGYTDGGRGIADATDTAARSQEDLSIVQSNTGFGIGGSFDVNLTGTFLSTTSGNTLVLQGYGTALRLYYSRQPVSGEFSYSVDGGAVVVVSANHPTLYTAGVITVTGLAEGLHTITVTNLGGTPLGPPGAWQLGTPNYEAVGATGFSSGTVYYQMTAVTASGETLVGPTGSKEIPNGPRSISGYINAQANPPITSYKVYRSLTGAAGSFQYILTIANPGTGFAGWNDDNTATPGAEPPTENTAGMDSTNKTVAVVAEFFREDAGIVYHKNGISGIDFSAYFSPLNTFFGNMPAQIALGMTPGIVGSPNGFGWGMPEGPHPQYRDVKLAICALGVNDQQGGTVPATVAANIEQGIGIFARMTRAVGADPLVVIPHNQYAVNAHTLGGTVAAAIRSAADAHNCAVVDFNEALGPINTGAALWDVGPHINQAGYDAEATFLWNNCLAL